MTNPFKPAERKQTPLKLGFQGPPSSGKTYSSLVLARGLVGAEGQIAVADTENGSASLYENLTNYDTMTLAPPFTVSKYLDAIKAAHEHGYAILIIDSASHLWKGSGGLLELKDELAAQMKNDYGAWGPIDKQWNQFVAAVHESPIPIIVTMRTKNTTSVEQDDNGKTKIVKLGYQPVMRNDFEYELDIIWECGVEDHKSTAVRDRTGLFIGEPAELISEDTARLLNEWHLSGAEFVAPITTQTGTVISKLLKARGYATSEQRLAILSELLGRPVKGPKDILSTEADDLIASIKEMTNNAEV